MNTRKFGEFLEDLKDLKEEMRHLMKLLFDIGVGDRATCEYGVSVE